MNRDTDATLTVITKASHPSPSEAHSKYCDFPTCEETQGLTECECCTALFCSDHGSRGFDQCNPGYADSYVPDRCFNCGGFNVDE